MAFIGGGRTRVAFCLFALAVGAGCSRGDAASTMASSGRATSGADAYDQGVAFAEEAPPSMPQQGAYEAPAEASVSGPRYAQAPQARPSRPSTQAAQPGSPASTHDPAVATDASTPGPLLVYTANFHLAVYEVRESMNRMIAAARELGGFVASEGDAGLVIRVPARRFDEAVAKVEEIGQVVHREVRAADVGEEYRDVAIRIRNLEAMRQRVEQMLAQATKVEEALQVERELARITDELERLKGRMRFLEDRIAFATLTIAFAARANEAVGQEDVPSLPFPWLDRLGLGPLLQF